MTQPVKYVVVDAEGYVVVAALGVPPSGAIIVGPDFEISQASQLYVDGVNGLTPRPSSPRPAVDGNDVTLAACPVGTAINVVDAVTGEVLGDMTTTVAEDVVITLPDAGEYQITCAAPLPHLETLTTVTIT